MTLETVLSIEVESFDRSLLVKLVGSGEPWYQTVNYTAIGVEWHNNLSAFRFDMKGRKSDVHWFSYILEILEGEIDVRLKLNSATTWTNVPSALKREIEFATG